MRPMLATRGTTVPSGAEWLHEVKWDGVRILADVTSGDEARFYSRNGNVVSAAWPDLVTSPLGDRDLLVGLLLAQAWRRRTVPVPEEQSVPA